MNVVIYARVSTDKQDLEQQVKKCEQYCDIKGWDKAALFTEKVSTRKERPILRQVIKECMQGKYQTIVMFRLDRGWRSSRQFIMDFDSLSARGCNVISVMEGLDPTTSMGKAMMTIIVALAELERANISAATKQRLDALKAMGKKLGRPKGSGDKKKRITKNYYGNDNRSNKRGPKKRGDF